MRWKRSLCIVHVIISVCLQYQSLCYACGGDLPWGELLTLPQDKHGKYKNNLDCTFQANLKFTESIAPNVLQLSWHGFDIAGDLPECDTDYVEIFVR